MTRPEEFYATQLSLEGLRFDSTGHLERFKDMPGESGPPPRVTALMGRGEQRLSFAAGLDPDLEGRVLGLSFATVWDGRPEFFDALRVAEGGLERREHLTYTPSGRARVEAGSLAQRLSSGDERLRHFEDGFFGIDYADVFAVLADGKVVAAAASSREDEAAAEAWVFVSPPYRRRGLAGHVARAWLVNAQERGLIPFYSHLAENLASRGLARSLRLTLRFGSVNYSGVS